MLLFIYLIVQGELNWDIKFIFHILLFHANVMRWLKWYKIRFVIIRYCYTIFLNSIGWCGVHRRIHFMQMLNEWWESQHYYDNKTRLMILGFLIKFFFSDF